MNRKRERLKILLHTDAAQALGKIHVDALELGVDYLTIVGHKVSVGLGTEISLAIEIIISFTLAVTSDSFCTAYLFVYFSILYFDGCLLFIIAYSVGDLFCMQSHACGARQSCQFSYQELQNR